MEYSPASSSGDSSNHSLLDSANQLSATKTMDLQGSQLSSIGGKSGKSRIHHRVRHHLST